MYLVFNILRISITIIAVTSPVRSNPSTEMLQRVVGSTVQAAAGFSQCKFQESRHEYRGVYALTILVLPSG